MDAIKDARYPKEQVMKRLAEVPPPEYPNVSIDQDGAKKMLDQGVSALNSGDTATALKMFEMAHLSDFASAEIMKKMGEALLKESRNSDAARAFSDALARRPRDSSSYVGLASAWATNGPEFLTTNALIVAYFVSDKPDQTLALIKEMAAAQKPIAASASAAVESITTRGSQ
jgi:predicted Zn-dependent protease